MNLLIKFLSYCASPLILAHLAKNCLKDPAYRVRIKERFAFVPRMQTGSTVWIHAVSAGEVIAVAPLVENLRTKFPAIHFLVTTTTPTGASEVMRRLGQNVTHLYAPYDLPDCVNRFIKRQNPAILILVETELWPNLISAAHARGIPIYLINARLSEKSAQNYGRFKQLTKLMLNKLSGIACQYDDSALRFKSLGVNPDLLSVTGSVKFDVNTPPSIDARTEALREEWGFERQVLIAASTHPTEELVVLDAYRTLLEEFPNLFLIIVPRHPPRAQEVVTLCRSYGYTHRLLSESPTRVQILVVDEMGVLLPIFGMGDVTFIGGSLQGTGGHNPIEPAVQRIPMLMGPDRQNFHEICHRFDTSGALETVRTAEEISAAVAKLLNDPGLVHRRTTAASRVVEINQGATARLDQSLVTWIKSATAQTDS